MFEQFHHLMSVNPALFFSFVFILSLLVGSFLNVVIYRLPKMMQNQWQQECRVVLEDELKKQPQQSTNKRFDLIKPDSHCPSCKTKLKPWHNIPILSYLFLKGKCGHCGVKISLRYPAIELLTAVSSTLVAVQFGYGLQTLLLVAVTWAFVALIFIDLDEMLLPDQITLPLLWLVLFASQWHILLSPAQTIAGAIAGYLSLWSVYWLFKLLTGKEGMGYGDFKLLAVIGAIVGIMKLPMVILMSSLVGVIIIGSAILFGDKSQHQPSAFGPYLAIAGWITFMWGDGIFNWYIGLLT